MDRIASKLYVLAKGPRTTPIDPDVFALAEADGQIAWLTRARTAEMSSNWRGRTLPQSRGAQTLRPPASEPCRPQLSVERCWEVTAAAYSCGERKSLYELGDQGGIAASLQPLDRAEIFAIDV